MLSDVMKQVVEEVLKGNKTTVTSSPGRQASSSSSSSGLSGIKRPNYQQMKKDQRLSALKHTNKSGSTNEQQSSHQLTNHQPQSGQNRSRQTSGSFSDLNAIKLGQGNVSRKHDSPNVPLNNDSREAKIIGKTKDGGCVWFFGEPAHDLMNHFKRPIQGAAVGVVRMPICAPSQLLIINEMVRANPDLKFHICWEDDRSEGFTAELYDQDGNRLKRTMDGIYQQLHRRSMKRVEAYTETAPSPWLSKQLQISGSQEAVGVLEGTSYYTNIVLMNKLLSNCDHNAFRYQINNNYILLQGKENIISKHILELQKDATRLISSDMTV